MCYIDLLYNSAGASCVWVKAPKNEFSTDLEIGGWGGHPDPYIRGWGGGEPVSKNLFSVWTKNRGEGSGSPGPLPWIRQYPRDIIAPCIPKKGDQLFYML